MVAQHTPGPWMVEPQPDMLGNDTEELVVRADRKEVCRLDPDMLEVPRSEWSGNANLIAAAPELLEALENCGEVLDNVRCHLGICGPGDDGERKADAPDNWGILSALDDCRAAIARAKGGAA